MGCRTLTGPASASFASVTIENQTAKSIAAATTEVFLEEGYRGGMTTSGQLAFDKEASKATTFAREGLVTSYYGGSTICRVRVAIVPLGVGSFRLQCQAFMVTGGGDAFFQDEVPLTNLRSGPYQALMYKVKRKLQ